MKHSNFLNLLRGIFFLLLAGFMAFFAYTSFFITNHAGLGIAQIACVILNFVDSGMYFYLYKKNKSSSD